MRCHDGHFIGLDIRDRTIELRFHRVDGTGVKIYLNGVRYFAMDRFLEGNIVDAAYAWPFAMAPGYHRRNAFEMFSCNEELLNYKNDFDTDTFFILESSYGASIYALVRQVEVIDSDGFQKTSLSS